MISSMGRWEPNARGRLTKAAWELYAERGYEQTTAAEIAKRAGLTERTFFRHFADKRETFFAGAELLTNELQRAIDAASPELSAFETVRAAVAAIAVQLTNREFSQRRQRIIDANPELQERERAKLASLTTTLAVGLVKRGVTPTAATLVAELGIAVFRIAFERWIDANESRAFTALVHDGFDQLRAVTA
jgi:AcrR family transcriptional regulator